MSRDDLNFDSLRLLLTPEMKMAIKTSLDELMYHDDWDEYMSEEEVDQVWEGIRQLRETLER